MIDPREYDEYFVPALFEPWSRELIRRAHVWKGDTVVDLACGTGIVACRIAGTGATVTGIDASADRLARAAVRATEESDATAALAPTIVDDKLEMMTSSVIGVGRVWRSRSRA